MVGNGEDPEKQQSAHHTVEDPKGQLGHQPMDHVIQAQAKRNLLCPCCGSHGHELVFQRLETCAGSFYSPKLSFLVVLTKKHMTGERCVHGDMTPWDAVGFGRGSEEEGTLPSPRPGQEGRKEHCQDMASHRGQGPARKGCING